MERGSALGGAAGDVWVFGYASLIWRPSFPFVERRRAAVEGFARRLWQGSDDHRGVPGAPGRVATLIPMEGARCVGVAFRVAEARAQEVLVALDHREKNGYERHLVDLLEGDGHPGRSASFARGIVFVANERNENFLGDAPLESIVRQIQSARGPSGDNREYVLELARALRALDAHDEHVEQIAEALESVAP